MYICVPECMHVYPIHVGFREDSRSPEMHSLVVTRVLETELRSSSRSVSVVNHKTMLSTVTYFLLRNTDS